MTRFARGGEGNHKRPLDATTWTKMKKETEKKRKCSQNKDSAKPKEQYGTFKDSNFNSDSQNSGKPKEDDSDPLTQRLHASGATASDRVQVTNGQDFPGSSNVNKRSIGRSLEEEELMTLYKKEKRREDRRVKRINTKADEQVCFNCRGTGHQMADCPKAKRDVEHGTGICFKCGSTEHVSARCSVKLPPGKYPYAKCFICGEMGHLSKQCPDNPKGLYPLGGCCNICESVEHYQRDCPQLQMKQMGKGICLPTWDPHVSADAEIADEEKPKPPPKKKAGPKIVKF